MSQVNMSGSAVTPQPPMQTSGPAGPVTQSPGRTEESGRIGTIPAELYGAIFGGSTAKRVFLSFITAGLSEVARMVLVPTEQAQTARAAEAAERDVPPAPPRADVFNRSLIEGLKGREASPLPPEYRAALGEALGSLRERFGEDILPGGDSLACFPLKSELMQKVEGALKTSTEAVSPQTLCALIEEKGAAVLASQVLEGRIKACCDELGFEGQKPAILRGLVLDRDKPLSAALSGCSNRQAADAAIEAAMPGIKNYIELRQELKLATDLAKEHAIVSLAAATGLSEGIVRQSLNLSKLENSFKYLGVDVLGGKSDLRGEELVSAMRAKAEHFVEQKAQLYKSVDELGLSPRMADEWKALALAQDTLDRGDIFTRAYRVGSAIQSPLLLQALQAPAGEFGAEDIAGLFITQGVKLAQAVQDHYGREAWQELGGDGQQCALDFAAQAMLSATPGLAEALADNADMRGKLGEALQASMNQGMDMAASSNAQVQEQGTILRFGAHVAEGLLQEVPPAAAEHNARMAFALGDAEGFAAGFPLHAQALESAVRDLRARFGEDCLPKGGLNEVLGVRLPGDSTTLSARLGDALRSSAAAVTSGAMAEHLTQIVRGTLVQGVFRNLLMGMGDSLGLKLDDSVLNRAIQTLQKRHPGLAETLAGAESRAAVEQLLADMPETAAILRVEDEIRIAMEGGMADIQARISNATGLPLARVKEQLNLTDVSTDGGKFFDLMLGIRGACEDAAKSPDAEFPPGKAAAYFQEIADRFVGYKLKLYNTVPKLGLSERTTARWRTQVLSNHGLKDHDFLRLCVSLGKSLPHSGLEAALGENGVEDVELFGLFRSFAAQFNEQVQSMLGADAVEEMDSDQDRSLKVLAWEAYLDFHPRIAMAIGAQDERMQRLIELGQAEAGEILRQMTHNGSGASDWKKLQKELAWSSAGVEFIHVARAMAGQLRSRSVDNANAARNQE